MQKEVSQTVAEDFYPSRTTPENDQLIGGSTNEGKEPQPGENISRDAGGEMEFERLIKGPYKKEFSKRVQGIINKRFKEKMSESLNSENSNNGQIIKSDGSETVGRSIPEQKAPKPEERSFSLNKAELAGKAAEIVAMGYENFELSKELENPTFKALLEGGVDMLTAYQAMHFNEIMDSSVRFGAETAAKQMADSIRFKAGRPGENGLIDRTGFGTRSGVSSLTPQKRRELARKPMKGEEISF